MGSVPGCPVGATAKNQPGLMRRFVWILALALTPLLTQGQDAVRHDWQGEPIPIQVPIGADRRIVIEGAEEIRIGVPSELGGAFQARSIGNSTWWQATVPLDREQILISAPPFPEMIIAEVTAQPETPPLSNLVIRVPESSDPPTASLSTPPGFTKLTRWAIQQLYSPARLRTQLPSVSLTSVSSDPINLFRCGPVAPSACGGAVQATPVAAWRTETHFVTAVHLENRTPESIVLDPRDLRGRWRTAAFVNSRLAPAGNVHAATILVLISDEPPIASLQQ